MEYVGSSNLSENEQEELVNLCNEFLQEVRTAIQIYLDLISGCQQNLDMANQTTDILEKIGQARDVSKCEIIRDFSEHDSIKITPTRMGFIKKQISLLIESLKSSIPVETVWRIE
ncbi:MAG: hypothetical protein ACKPFD_02540 [Dolichospermum sp.]